MRREWDRIHQGPPQHVMPTFTVKAKDLRLMVWNGMELGCLATCESSYNSYNNYRAACYFPVHAVQVSYYFQLLPA